MIDDKKTTEPGSNHSIVRVLPNQVSALERPQSQEMVERTVRRVIDLDHNSLEAKNELVEYIEKFGTEDLRASASKNHFLKITVDKLSAEDGDTGHVSKSLANLQREIANLDPSDVDFSKRGIFNLFFNPIKRYFVKYKKAEVVIAEILESLKRGKNSLINDNIALDTEKSDLIKISERLKENVAMGLAIDERLVEVVGPSAEVSMSAEKVKFIEEDILVPLRQQIMDIQQSLLVTHQCVLSMEVITRNNKELSRCADRAINVTVAALRTSVMVAGALYNQRLVLKKIQAVNDTTNSLIANSAKTLKQQGTMVGKQAMESAMSVETLKNSIKDALEAFEEIGRFRREALVKTRETIEKFKELTSETDAQLAALGHESR
ncbi:MAG: toxic anion resistance protein [Deltaproteobacteria bacterium]|jgi:uncharacterized protein YaaN involved in tellurite resistance|nr:toxic anion resistance protein [Deltaproteobacteria bacterium]